MHSINNTQTALQNGLRFISENELAGIINIKPKTLQRWRLAGIGPKFRKLGNANAKRSPIRYDLAAVQDWLAAQSEGGGGSAGEGA